MKRKWIKFCGVIMATVMLISATRFGALTVYASDGGYSTSPDTSGTETETDEKEKKVLTPDGNMELVDDIDGEETDMQFLTVTTKDGHYFYIIIERNKDSENVHFLNQVDIRDLLTIMSEDEVKEYQESQKKEDPEPVTPIITPEPDPEPEPEPETPAKKNTANPFLTLGLFGLIGAAVAGGYYFVKIKPSKGRNGYDDDLDFDDDADYVEEQTEVEEPTFRDEDSEEE